MWSAATNAPPPVSDRTQPQFISSRPQPPSTVLSSCSVSLDARVLIFICNGPGLFLAAVLISVFFHFLLFTVTCTGTRTCKLKCRHPCVTYFTYLRGARDRSACVSQGRRRAHRQSRSNGKNRPNILVHRFRNSNHMPRHSGSRPEGPRARNLVITSGAY